MTLRQIKTPTMAECKFQTPELPTSRELSRMGVEVEPEEVARIRANAAATVYTFHPDADDCFRVMGMGRSAVEAYRAMLDDLHDHYANDLDDAEYEAMCAVIEGRKAAA